MSRLTHKLLGSSKELGALFCCGSSQSLLGTGIYKMVISPTSPGLYFVYGTKLLPDPFNPGVQLLLKDVPSLIASPGLIMSSLSC